MFKKNYRVRKLVLSCIFLGLATPAVQATIPLLLYEVAYTAAEVLPLVAATCRHLISILANKPASLDQKALTTTAPQPIAIKIANHAERVCRPEFVTHINAHHQQAYKNVFDFVMQSYVDKKELSAEWGHLASKSMGQSFHTALQEGRLHQELQQHIILAVEQQDIQTKIQNDPAFASEYQHAFDFAYSRILDVVRYHKPSDYALRVETLLDLNNIHLPGLAGQIFNNFREELNTLCFDKKGNLQESLSDQKIAAAINLFIKICSPDQKTYIANLQKAYESGIPSLHHHIQTASKEPFQKATSNPFLQRSGLHAKIIDNKENQELCQLIISCKQGDFNQAHRYTKTKIAKKVYASLYGKAYHSYGVPRFYDNDPLVRNLSAQDKVDLKNNSAIRAGFIKELENRFQIHQELMLSCAIPPKHPLAVNQALYNAIPYVGNHDEFLKYCNQFYNDGSPENKEICAAFFTPNGILKMWDKHTTTFKDLDKPSGLNLAENNALRLHTNRLLLVNVTEANTPMLQQVYKYSNAATQATESARETYCAMVENSILALYGSHEHAFILSCPDCTKTYATPEQNAVQQLIMQRFIQVTQTTDQAKKTAFKNQIAPLLQRAYQYNHESHGLIANAVIIAADNHDQIKHIGQGLGSTALVALGYKFFEQAKNKLQRQSNQQPVSQKPSANAPDPEDPKKRKDEHAQAPGMPIEKDGYTPPKKWDGKRVKNPNGPGYGWPDKKGNVWVPTGNGGAKPGTTGSAHGGPHWDVQDPKTGLHKNILPGGKIR